MQFRFLAARWTDPVVEDRLYIMIPKLSKSGCFSKDSVNTIERVLPSPWVSKMVQSIEAFVGLSSKNAEETAGYTDAARISGILNVLTISSIQTQNWDPLVRLLHARLTLELKSSFETEQIQA